MSAVQHLKFVEGAGVIWGAAYEVSNVCAIFMPPAWKVRRGHLVIGSSVRPSVCASVIPSRLQIKSYN